MGELLTMLESSCLRVSLMSCLVRWVVPAPMRTWSRFQEKMAGDGNDSDDLIVQAFKAYDFEGKIDSKMFEHALKTWGDKMTKAEIEDIFGEFEIDEDYCIKTKEVISLFVAVKEEEKKEPTPPPEVVEAPPPEEEDDSKKKKKKKKRLLSKCHPSHWCSGCVLSSTTPCKKDTCANATCPVSYTQSDNALVYQQIFLFLPLL